MLLRSLQTNSPCGSWPSTFPTRQPRHRSHSLNLILSPKQYGEMDLRTGTKPTILGQESNRRDQLASSSSHTTSLRTSRNKTIAILWTYNRHQTFKRLPGWSLNRVQIWAKPAILKQIKTSTRRTWKWSSRTLINSSWPRWSPQRPSEIWASRRIWGRTSRTSTNNWSKRPKWKPT